MSMSKIFSTLLLFWSTHVIIETYTERVCETSDLFSPSVFIRCQNAIAKNMTEINAELISLAPDPTNVTNLEINGRELHLSPLTLKPFVNLVHFRMDGCNGVIIQHDHCRDLDTKRTTVPSDAFSSAIAGHSYNRLAQIEFGGIDFPTLENLRSIFQPFFGQLTLVDFRQCLFSQTSTRNDVGYDPFQVISKFTMLQFAGIIGSGITTVPARAFEKSGNTMLRISLNDNRIVTIDVNAFKGLFKMRNLFLQNNRIISIEAGTFDDLTSLEYIRLDTNQIAHLPNTLFKNTRLEYLNLLNNPIRNLGARNFTGPINITSILAQE